MAGAAAGWGLREPRDLFLQSASKHSSAWLGALSAVRTPYRKKPSEGSSHLGKENSAHAALQKLVAGAEV